MAQNYKTIDQLGAANAGAGEVPVYAAGVTGKLSYSAYFPSLMVLADAQAWRVALGIPNAMNFQGAINASGNPNYPAATKGDVYKISVGGKIGGASGAAVEAGDTIYCVVTSAAGDQATVGANWDIVQANIDGAVTGPANAADGTPAVFDGASGNVIKNITYAAFKTLLVLAKGDVGLGNVDNTSDATKNAAAVTLSNKTIDTPIIIGTATDDDAAAGEVGEYISVTKASGDAVPLANTTATDITSIALTAGDWEVWGTIGFSAAPSTVSSFYEGWISTASSTQPGFPATGAQFYSSTPSVPGFSLVAPTGKMRVSLAASATIYLSAISSFSVSTLAAYGFMAARRVR